MRHKRVVLTSILVGIGGVCCVLVWILSVQKQPSTNAVFQNPECTSPMIWAHRGGAHGSLPDNSLAAIDGALGESFCGIEVDVYWSEQGHFVVQHDPPAEGVVAGPSLAQVFERVEARNVYWWLDFKNLTARNAEAAAKYLARLAASHSLQYRIFVESPELFQLAYFGMHADNVRTVYWIASALNLRSPLNYLRTLLVLAFVNPAIVSIPYVHYGWLHETLLSGRLIMAFSPSLEPEIDDLFETGVSVVLTRNRYKKYMKRTIRDK